MSLWSAVLVITVVIAILALCLHAFLGLSRDMGGLCGEPDCRECGDRGCAECDDRD